MGHRRILSLPLLGLSFALVGCSIPNTGGQSTSVPAFGASSENTSAPVFGQSSATSAPGESSTDSSVATSAKTRQFTITWVTFCDYVIADQVVDRGTVIENPPVPELAGYVFAGWFTDPEVQYPQTFPCTIYNNKTFYAGWQSPNGVMVSIGSKLDEDVTYTFDSLPSWAGANERVIFAWAWPDGSEGAWYPCESVAFYEDGAVSAVSFTVSYQMAGLLLVSTYAGTTDPDWMIASPMPGAVMAQTIDFPVEDGVTTYSAPEEVWMVRIFE